MSAIDIVQYVLIGGLAVVVVDLYRRVANKRDKRYRR